jgi:hypothetical protein
MQHYSLKEALNIVESGAWFSLRFITANIAKGTGGKIVELAKVKLHSKPKLSNPTAQAAAGEKSKSQNHHLHFTRNVETQARQIIKVHPILITHVNNTPVL